MLDLHLIRTDGGTQSRVKLNDEVVAEYAEAYKAGAMFPAVTIFYDGSDRWLADGFHRFFGAKSAGKKSILENIIPGTLRDAKLFSFGANGAHGQRTTTADKRKAVEAMLADAEWVTWSDRKIAEACGVSHSFVAAIRNPQVAQKQKENRQASSTKKATKVESDSTSVGDTEPQKQPAKPAKPAYVEPEDSDYSGPSNEELQAAQEAAKADVDKVMELLESDDPKAELLKENECQRLEIATLKSQRDGYMNQANELIRRVKSLKKMLEKAQGK